MIFDSGDTGDAGGYQIERSLRLRRSASAYISRTPASSGNRRKWTWAGWVKRGQLGLLQSIASVGNVSSFYMHLFEFQADDTLRFYYNDGGTTEYLIKTNRPFRDPSAHVHLTLIFDVANATTADRVRIYVNGVRETSFSTANTFPNEDGPTSAVLPHSIGRTNYDATRYFDGLLSEVYFVDGQALDPTYFGQFNIDGVWVPKAYTGTFGANGFKLDFSNGSSLTTLGNDASGNGNNWTLNNFSLTAGPAYDWMVDTPTNNYAVLNSLNPIASGVTYSEGNLKLAIGSPSGGKTARSTMPFPSSGLTYLEILSDNSSDASTGIGFGFMVGSAWYYLYASSAAVLYANGSTQASGLTLVTGGVTYQLALDAATGKAWIGRNNVWYNSTGGTTGDPTTGANPTFTLPAGECSPFIYGDVTTTITFKANFGQRPFAYTPPTGFKALCTANMPAVAVPNGRKQFDVLLYTSSSSAAQNITGAQFQPDLAWFKCRSAARHHALFDSVRGANQGTYPSLTNAEGTWSGQAFLSNGVTVDRTYSAETNALGYGETFVSWLWKAGGAAVTNNVGSVTAQVSANPAAGISIVTFATPASGAFTVGHGLGVTPSLIIEKQRGSTGGWPVWFSGYGTADYLYLNQAAAKGSAAAAWGSAAPNSSTFGMTAGTLTGTSLTQVAYCFAEVPGFSKFSSYTGNGSADGTFVYCGFRPRYLLIKSSSHAYDWFIYDTARNVFNAATYGIYGELANVEFSLADSMDILSNGFKLRANLTGLNQSGVTYIFVAFAENPFGGSNVAPAPAR